jgi:hypothetical protein
VLFISYKIIIIITLKIWSFSQDPSSIYSQTYPLPINDYALFVADSNNIFLQHPLNSAQYINVQVLSNFNFSFFVIFHAFLNLIYTWLFHLIHHLSLSREMEGCLIYFVDRWWFHRVEYRVFGILVWKVRVWMSSVI